MRFQNGADAVPMSDGADGDVGCEGGESGFGAGDAVSAGGDVVCGGADAVCAGDEAGSPGGEIGDVALVGVVTAALLNERLRISLTRP
jgi:hypothetical protein